MTSPLEKKLKISGPSIVTANRTRDGVVIFRTANKSWSQRLEDAAVVRTAAEAQPLLSEAIADDLGAVGAYIAPVQVDSDGQLKPANLRERIRLEGATIDLPVAV